jgi:hypothetical protein
MCVEVWDVRVGEDLYFDFLGVAEQDGSSF